MQFDPFHLSPGVSWRESGFSVNCGVFVLEKVCTVLQRLHFTVSVEGREACDSLASGAELCLKSCSTGHIPFSGTLGNLFAKPGLKLSGS